MNYDAPIGSLTVIMTNMRSEANKLSYIVAPSNVTFNKFYILTSVHDRDFGLTAVLDTNNLGCD